MNTNTKSILKNISAKTLIRLILIIVLLIEAYPFVWNLMSALKTNTEFMTDPLAFPHGLAWDNFARAYVKANLGAYIGNSFLITVETLVLTLLCAVPCSYCLVRYRFFGSQVLLGIFMSLMFISGNYIIVPLFLQMKAMNMLDNVTYLSIVYAAFQIPGSVFLLSGYMSTIERDYEEAAKIDGCGPFGVLRHIAIPLARPGIVTISLLTVMSAFNEYPMALVTLMDDKNVTLPVGIARLFQIQQYATDWGAMFAGLVLAMIPTIILFLICEKQLLRGISIGGIKG